MRANLLCKKNYYTVWSINDEAAGNPLQRVSGDFLADPSMMAGAPPRITENLSLLRPP